MSHDPARARRGLAIYFGVLVPLSAAIEWQVLTNGTPIDQQIGLIALLMWVPTLASLVARVVLSEGVRDVSFRWPRAAHWHVTAIMWLFPVVVGLVAYGAAWLSGLVAMAPLEGSARDFASAPALLVALRVALNVSVGTATAILVTAGEEIGWRGYMLTRLFEAGVQRPVFVSGVIWSAWHLPMVLSGQYASSANPVLSAALFLIGVAAVTYLFSWSRLESGSVWPAIIGHASWNAVIQNAFDRSTAGPTIWVGEAGVLVVAVNVLVVLLIVRKPWQVRLTPRDEPIATLRAPHI